MYNSKKYAQKETDFNPNEKVYEKYFGAAWMKFFVEKLFKLSRIKLLY